MNLSIEQEESGLQVVGKFFSENYRYTGVSGTQEYDDLPDLLKPLVGRDEANVFLTATITRTGSQQTFLFADKMISYNKNGTPHNGMLIVYDPNDINVFAKIPTKGTVKHGAGG